MTATNHVHVAACAIADAKISTVLLLDSEQATPEQRALLAHVVESLDAARAALAGGR